MIGQHDPGQPAVIGQHDPGEPAVIGQYDSGQPAVIVQHNQGTRQGFAKVSQAVICDWPNMTPG